MEATTRNLRCYKSKAQKWRHLPKCHLPPLARLHTRRSQRFQNSDSGIKKIRVYADARGRVKLVHYVDTGQRFEYEDLWDLLDNVAILLIQPYAYFKWYHNTYKRDPMNIPTLSISVLLTHCESLCKCAALMHGYFFPDPHLSAVLELLKQLTQQDPTILTDENVHKATLNAVALLFETFYQSWF